MLPPAVRADTGSLYEHSPDAEIKTRSFDGQHLVRVREMALWLQARRRRWCPAGALPVICVLAPARLERVEAEMLIVSPDRLPAALRGAGARSSARRSSQGPRRDRESTKTSLADELPGSASAREDRPFPHGRREPRKARVAFALR